MEAGESIIFRTSGWGDPEKGWWPFLKNVTKQTSTNQLMTGNLQQKKENN